MQISEVYKSFTLLMISVLSLGVLSSAAAALEISRFVVYPVGLIIVWLLYVIIVEILPRQSSRKAIAPKMLKRLWVLRGIYVVFSPILHMYRTVARRSGTDEKVTEEEKEEILERAIETVAEHAGIGERIVDDEEKAMIGQIFLLDQTVVREIMIPR
jgi:CBS domain containing-hemolysin-like protein